MKYTINHSLPIIEPAKDLIASPSAGTLAGDINRLALATGTAIDAEAARSDAMAMDTAVSAIADADLASNADPRFPLQSDPTVTHAWTDPAGRSPLWAGNDGSVRAPLPVITPAAGTPMDGFAAGTYDPATGRMAENAVDTDGLTPQWVLDAWAERMQVGGTRRAGVALTCSAGSAMKDSAPAVHLRLPFRIAPAVSRIRVHLRNYNDRDAVTYGTVAVAGLWWGEHFRATSGELTGQFRSAPTQISGAIAVAGSSETVTPWIEVSTKERGEYLLSLGYTTTGTNHLAVGGCWRSTTPEQAGDATPTTPMTKEQYAPLDLWVEVEIPATIGVFAAGPGDSTTVGTAASLPVYDSWPARHALASGTVAQMYANHGSTLADWTNGTQWKYQKYSVLDRPDAAIISVGANSIYGGRTLDEYQSDFRAVAAVTREEIAEQIFLTNMKPRNTPTDPAMEDVRHSVNTWMETDLPAGTVLVFDFAAAVAAPDNPDRLAPQWTSSDNVHLNSAGYARATHSITHPIA